MILLTLAAAIAPIDYRLAITAAPIPIVTVTMAFRGDADGETIVDLPDAWAGSSWLSRNVSPIAVRGGTLRPATGATWRIRHRPNARLTIRYAVRDGQPGIPDAATYEKAQPIVERDWIFLHGEGAIAIPHGRDDAPARFAFGPVARGWTAASDLEHAFRLSAANVAGAIVIAAPALRVTARPIGERTLRIATIGRWPFSDAALADRMATLARTENAMMGARAADYFVPLVPLTGSATGVSSYGGSGRTAGFALAATDNVPLDEIARLLAHEYGHRWFGKGFGAVADGAGPYWFTEGVNDWFADRAMVRAGLWTRAQWVAALNARLRRYGMSGARTLDDAALTAQFWTNPEAMQIQYDRGALAALLLDAAVPGGIAPTLRAMAARPDGRDQVARFAQAFPAALAAARAAAAAPLSPEALAACGRIVAVAQPTYDRGFAMDADRIVTAATGNAAAAGVRAGLRFVRRIASDHGNAAVPYRAEFDDRGTPRTLAWLPAGTGTVRFQQLDPGAIDTPACATLVAGSALTP